MQAIQTTDYSKFHYLETNRDLDERHVQELMKSFKETGGNIMPGLANKDMGILDGQHGLEACKRTGLPFKYIVYEGSLTDEEVMIEMNIFSKNWTTQSYAEHAAKLGKSGYVEFMDVFNKTGVSFSALVALCRTSKTKIVNADPIVIPEGIENLITVMFEITTQFKAAAKLKPRDEVIAKAMILVQDEFKFRASRGDNVSAAKWNYDRVVKNLSSVLDDLGVSDNPQAIYKKLSAANDYNLARHNQLKL